VTLDVSLLASTLDQQADKFQRFKAWRLLEAAVMMLATAQYNACDQHSLSHSVRWPEETMTLPAFGFRWRLRVLHVPLLRELCDS